MYTTDTWISLRGNYNAIRVKRKGTYRRYRVTVFDDLIKTGFAIEFGDSYEVVVG